MACSRDCSPARGRGGSDARGGVCSGRGRGQPGNNLGCYGVAVGVDPLPRFPSPWTLGGVTRRAEDRVWARVGRSPGRRLQSCDRLLGREGVPAWWSEWREVDLGARPGTPEAEAGGSLECQPGLQDWSGGRAGTRLASQHFL